MRKILITTVAFLLCNILIVRAQNVSDLIISEIMAEPDSLSITDDFGRRNGWIEIFNTSQGTVNFGGCFITDDRENLKKSPFPKGDLRTKIGPRQTALFFASGNGEDGTFYTEFKLEKGKTIYLVSNDGKSIIDSLTISESLPKGMSVSKFPIDAKQQDFMVSEEFTTPTPNLKNGGISGQESKSQKMARTDPKGLILSFVSISVVFFALAILWLLFTALFKERKKKEVKKNDTKMSPEVAAAISMALSQEFGGETHAAIAMALHSYFNDGVHDNESFTITIKHNDNSQWNNKLSSFRKIPKSN